VGEGENITKDDYFDDISEYDSTEAIKLKEINRDIYKRPLEKIMKTNGYTFMKRSNLVCNQLLHFQLLNLSKKSFCFFNCGIPNFLIIVAGCYNKLTIGNGKPFMCVCLTKYPDRYNELFGKMYKYKYDKSHYLIVSNWRRLPVFKLTHMKDSYYSTLSSTMNSYLSSKDRQNYELSDKIIDIYNLRGIISLCTNQKVCELLMDTRYAYMSAFSTHTNIEKLLLEKFKPPYRCCIETWIVDKLLTNLPIIYNEVIEEGKIRIKKPRFMDGKRREDTIGGEICISSLWFKHSVYETQEIMDEAFIYVHTIKEPSNIYHEQIKAMMTIRKFQDEYNSLNYNRKHGLISKEIELVDFLLDENLIGCCNDIIYYSVKETIDSENPFIDKIVHELNDEPVSEIISTKAVIHDVDRKLTEEKMSRNDIERANKRKIKVDGKPLSEKQINELKKYKFDSKSPYYKSTKPRQKVIETILDIVSEKNFGKTIELANDFVVNDGGNVIADICIKSQYGSKREFYVINIGAKALARVCENFFKKICENSPNEAISIPGDKKMLEMQKMLDVTYQIRFGEKLKMKYVNGDCTKWSAAETMASFLSMTMAMKEKIPINMYKLLITTFSTWANKKIQIPLDILNKVIPLMSKTEYLKMGENITGTVNSTHNFLQGMFNYSSSYKAVCCSNYTYSVYKRLYPKTKLKLQHMEHSDDYVLIILYENESEFINFRILHKVIMKMHGFNDSTKKTSCQLFLLEFVSLMSFNGLMLYPQIKKSKEVNTSLPCTGYKTDSDAAKVRS
jgi:hypothetical protein